MQLLFETIASRTMMADPINPPSFPHRRESRNEIRRRLFWTQKVRPFEFNKLNL